MIYLSVLQSSYIGILLVILMSSFCGILSGFTGVGTGFIMVPTLMSLGLPANFAVGTSLTWIMGNSIVCVIRHRSMGNIDIKLGMVMSIFIVSGIEIGITVLNRLKVFGLIDKVILLVFIIMLLIIGIYTLLDCIKKTRQSNQIIDIKEKTQLHMRTRLISLKWKIINLPPKIYFAKSGIMISIWIILLLGLLVGLAVGTLGIGGGIIIVPALIYIFGMSSFMAVGTSLFQMIYSSAYGSIRYTLSGNVIIYLVPILLLFSSIGVHIGVLLARYVREFTVRLVLGIISIVVAISSILKFMSISLEKEAYYLNIGSITLTFVSTGIVMIMLLLLLFIAIRHTHGKSMPSWANSLLLKQQDD